VFEGVDVGVVRAFEGACVRQRTSLRGVGLRPKLLQRNRIVLGATSARWRAFSRTSNRRDNAGFFWPQNVVAMDVLALTVRKLPAKSALIDGEAVAFRPDGRSDFGALRTKAGGARACLVAFDLLNLNGDDLRQRPIEERRDRLQRLVAGVDGILFSEAIEAEGAIVFAKACEMGLEGIVSKRASSLYRSGASRSWLKSKNPAFVRT
jgi:bifunctional non-homologous end joining protein LigD